MLVDVNTAKEFIAPNVVVEDEHNVEATGSKFSDDYVCFVKLPEHAEVVTEESIDMEFDFETTKKKLETEASKQVNLLTAEYLVALIASVQKNVGNPPFAPSFTEQESPLDVDADLVPRKRRRRDPRPVVVNSVFELEQESLSHTFLIQELRTDNEANDKKIKSLETDMGHLSAVVYDLKQKLKDTFKGEFFDYPSPSSTSEPTPEASHAEFSNHTSSREERLRKYFAGDTGFKHVKKGFSDITLAKSVKIKKKTNSLGDPFNVDAYEVKWLATEWMKKVPILPDLPEGVLNNF
ncbi:hypothetical protein R6Q57_010165 [Mikania cordata]